MGMPLRARQALFVLALAFTLAAFFGILVPRMTSAQASVGANNPKCVAAGVYSCDWPSKDRYGRQCLRNRPCDYKKDVVEVKGTCQWVQGKPECSEKCYKNLTGACQAIGGAGKDQPEGKPPEIPQLKPPEKAGSGDSGGSESPPSQEQRLRDVNERLGELMTDEQPDPAEVGALQKEREDLLNRLANSPETTPAVNESAGESIMYKLFKGWFGGGETKKLDEVSGNPVDAYQPVADPYAFDGSGGTDTFGLPVVPEVPSSNSGYPDSYTSDEVQPSKGFWDTYVQPAADSARQAWDDAKGAAYDGLASARDAVYDAYTAAQETVQKTVADLWGVGSESSGPPTGVDENMTDFGPVADYRAVYETMSADSLRQELDRVQSDLSAGFGGGLSQEDTRDLLGQEQAIQEVMANRAASPVDENMAGGFSPPEQLPAETRVGPPTGAPLDERLVALKGPASYYCHPNGACDGGQLDASGRPLNAFDPTTFANDQLPDNTITHNCANGKCLYMRKNDNAAGVLARYGRPADLTDAGKKYFGSDGLVPMEVTPYGVASDARTAAEVVKNLNSGMDWNTAVANASETTGGRLISESTYARASVSEASAAVTQTDLLPGSTPLGQGGIGSDEAASARVQPQPSFLQQYAPWAQPAADSARQAWDDAKGAAYDGLASARDAAKDYLTASGWLPSPDAIEQPGDQFAADIQRAQQTQEAFEARVAQNDIPRQAPPPDSFLTPEQPSLQPPPLGEAVGRWWADNMPPWLGGAAPEPDPFPAEATDLVRGPATPVTPVQVAVTPEDTNMLEGFSPPSTAQGSPVYYDAFGGEHKTQEAATAADRSYGITGPEGSGQTPVSSVFQYGPETGKYGLDGLVKEIPQANSFEDPQRAQLADAMRRYLVANPEALKKFSPDAYVMKDGDIGFKKNEGQADMSVFNDPKFAETITKYEKTHLSPVLGGKDGVDNFIKSFGESAQPAPASAADADRSRTSAANPSGSSDQTPAAPSQTSQTKASPQTAKPLLDQIVSRAGSLVNKLDQGYPLSASDVRANERLQSAALSEVNRQLKANPANMQLQATKTFIAGFSPGDPNSIRRLWRYLQK